jgi:PAS domain S-box-containing protein
MKASEHQLRMILESEPEGVSLIAFDGTVIEMNPAGLRLFEAREFSEVNEQTMAALVAPEFRGPFCELNETIFRGESKALELKIHGLKGTTRWVTIHACPLRDLEGRVMAQLAVISDITARKKAEQSIAHSLALLRATLESTTDGILTVGPDGRVVSFNQIFVKMWRIPDEVVETKDENQVLTFVLDQLVEPEQLLTKVRHLHAHPLEESFDSLRFKDGREFDRFSRPMLVNGQAAGRVWSFRDVTERKRAEANLAKAHKELLTTSRLAGMAEVATSVLHNVGNVLNSVNVSATLLRQNLGKPYVKNLALAANLLRENTANLVPFLTQDPRGQRFPAFLGKLARTMAEEQESQLQELDLLGKNIEHIKEIVAMQQNYATVSGMTEMLQAGELVEEALRMSETAFDHQGITLVRRFEPAPPILADRHKVLQILINLIRNAQQALAESSQPDKAIQLAISPVTGNGHVSIKVCDNGVGITDDNLKRIFEHGFTTKKSGHGFGLHSCANAAKEMHGTLRVDNRHEVLGTAFTLELPAAGSLDPAGQTNLHN